MIKHHGIRSSYCCR